MRTVKILIISLVIASVLGCSGGNGKGFSARSNEGKSGVLRYPLPTNPTSLDPHKVQDGDTLDMTQQVYEGLVKWGEDNSVQPNLAEKWTIDSAGTTYTFNLKKGVKFSNGREFTAEDVKWNLERACNPQFTSATAATYLDNIIGVKERLANKAKEVAGVKVVDKYTVTIQIDKPRPYFLGKLTYSCAYFLAKEGLKDPTQRCLRSR